VLGAIWSGDSYHKAHNSGVETGGAVASSLFHACSKAV